MTCLDKKIFILGNGKSRKGISLSLLRQQGKVYGCNLIHLEGTVDSLVALDCGPCHEIYHSGYPILNKTYFNNWISLPEEMYGVLVPLLKENYTEILENEKGDSTEFVIHVSQSIFSHAYLGKPIHNGNEVSFETKIKISNDKVSRTTNFCASHWKGLDSKRREELLNSNFLDWKKRGFLAQTIHISWVKDDKVETIDYDFKSCACVALDIACKTEKPQQVYLLGADFNRATTSGSLSTISYGKERPAIINESIDKLWKQEFKSCFQKYPNIEFIYVNNGKVEEWKDIDNIRWKIKI